METPYCALFNNAPQPIPADGAYHLLRFPYGEGESTDDLEMHAPEQPDGSVSVYPDDRSGLIWPAADGLGTFTINVQWEPGGYTELRDRIVRDPLGINQSADSTATDHRPPSPGMQCFTKVYQIKVWRTVPLGLLVAHNDSVTRNVTHAQFKLSIQP